MVDDDASMRRAVRNLLTSLGFDVQTFVSAEELLQSGKLEQIRVLILDLKLDGMSGLDLLARLRAMGALVKVIMLTAHGATMAERRAMELGAFAFVKKPFQPDALLNLVQAAVNSAPAVP